MKKKDAIQEIRIDFNCPIKWDSMEKNGQNRNCQTCNKTVIDFSLLSDAEFFKNIVKSIIVVVVISSITACNPTQDIVQSNSEIEVPQIQAPIELKIEIGKEGINPDSLNTTLIQGKVVSADGTPLQEIIFLIDQSFDGAITDINGNFELRLPIEKIKSETATILSLRYENISLKLDDIKNRKINITMGELSSTEEFIIMESRPSRRRRMNENQ